MSARRSSGIAFIALLLSSSVLATGIRPAKAYGTIYVRTDGSVDPPTAPIQRSGNLYTFTANITDPIVVGRSDIEIDGNAYTLQNSGTYYDSRGLDLTGRSNITIRNMRIAGFYYGIRLDACQNNVASGNSIATSSGYGVYLDNSDNNSVTENNIAVTSSGCGVYLDSSCDNKVSGNDIVSSGYGVYLYWCSYGNSVCGNNITGNWSSVYLEWYSDNNDVSRNKITSSGHCVFVCFSDNNQISRNNIRGGSWYCVFVDSSDNNSVNENNVTSSGDAVYLDYNSDNNSINGNSIATSGGNGIYLDSGSNDNIVDANDIVASGGHGIHIGFSDRNRVSGNNITASIGYGVYLDSAFSSIIVGNNVADSWYGVYLGGSSSALICRNNFVANTIQAYSALRATCIWDNGYEGNYWSNYNVSDPDQDGIGNTPYVIDGNNTDHYPLVNRYWIAADINHDLKVDTLDVAKITASYGTAPSSPNWSPHADIRAPFETIDILDLVLCTSHYGQVWP